jgi:hypothetical protein
LVLKICPKTRARTASLLFLLIEITGRSKASPRISLFASSVEKDDDDDDDGDAQATPC